MNIFTPTARTERGEESLRWEFMSSDSFSSFGLEDGVLYIKESGEGAAVSLITPSDTTRDPVRILRITPQKPSGNVFKNLESNWVYDFLWLKRMKVKYVYFSLENSFKKCYVDVHYYRCITGSVHHETSARLHGVPVDSSKCPAGGPRLM